MRLLIRKEKKVQTGRISLEHCTMKKSLRLFFENWVSEIEKEVIFYATIQYKEMDIT